MAPLTEYFGFAAGDKIIYNFWVENGKELKDLTISEFPNSVKFAQHSVEKIQNKVIEISKNSIYKFEYFNAHFLPRVINIKIQRLPRDLSTKSFNTNVKWITRTDTTFHQEETGYALTTDTSFEEVLNTKIKVNPKASTDNTHRSLIDFTLPANTLRWSYWIGVGEKALQLYEVDKQKASTELNPAFKNPLEAVAMGVKGMTQLKVGDNIRYFFISKPEETQKFINGAGFGQFKNGDAVADFALMNFSNKNSQKYYLGLSNESTALALEVNVRILALVVKKEYEGKREAVPVLSTNKVPVHEQ